MAVQMESGRLLRVCCRLAGSHTPDPPAMRFISQLLHQSPNSLPKRQLGWQFTMYQSTGCSQDEHLKADCSALLQNHLTRYPIWTPLPLTTQPQRPEYEWGLCLRITGTQQHTHTCTSQRSQDCSQGAEVCMVPREAKLVGTRHRPVTHPAFPILSALLMEKACYMCNWRSWVFTGASRSGIMWSEQ